jgi:hypothetical protein
MNSKTNSSMTTPKNYMQHMFPHSTWISVGWVYSGVGGLGVFSVADFEF